jgi:hypothetical protein
MKPSEYYVCTVGPVAGEVILLPGESYRLDMDAPGLQVPSKGGSSHQAVISSSEIEVLGERGFQVRLIRGPFSTESAASDSLDDWWEDSHRMGGDPD